MRTGKNIGIQEKFHPSTNEDDVTRIVSALDEFSAKIYSDGLHLPPTFAFGERGPVLMIEDRDALAKTLRSRRFDADAVAEVFGHAVSVTLVPYAARSKGQRVGLSKGDVHDLTLIDRLQTGGAVIIRTTSDRLRHWLELARRHCRRGATIEYFDASGVSRVVEGGL